MSSRVVICPLDVPAEAVLSSAGFAARVVGAGQPAITVSFEHDRVAFAADTVLFLLRMRVTALLESA
jgi:hypothetical protein